jgi:outer membrane protein assembly factor BamB
LSGGGVGALIQQSGRFRPVTSREVRTMLKRIFLTLLALALAVTLQAADWPQWRGPNRDGISQDTGLLQEWPEGGPKPRWKRTDIGTGYSSPVVVGGKVLVQTTRGKEEFALCLDEKTGKDIWTARIGDLYEIPGNAWPGTRATPTVDGDRAYCLSSKGQLVCLGTADGKEKWKKDFMQDLGGVVGMKEMNWAYCESVLVDGDLVICTPGGKDAAFTALNKITGEVVWKTTLDKSDNAEYSSLMPITAGGTKQYVGFLRSGLAGIDAKTGKLLWKYEKITDMASNIMTPIVYQDKVFAASSRGGGALLELKRASEPKEIYHEKALGTSIGGAVLVDGHLYGTTPAGLYCVEFATGKQKWQEGPIGGASICFADGRLFVRRYANGDIVLIEPNPKGYVEKGRVKQPNRSKFAAWPHPIVANGGLYVRDHDTLVCWDVKK